MRITADPEWLTVDYQVGLSDEAWQRACVRFDTEIHMIKGRMELGF